MTTLPTVAALAILLVVVHAIFLTATNLLKMKMMPATNRFSETSNFATQVLIASFASNGRGRSRLPFGCRDSPFLLVARDLQAYELLVENHLDLSFALDVFHH